MAVKKKKTQVIKRKTIIIGTRGSLLAITQSTNIRNQLRKIAHTQNVQLKRIMTSGDKFRDRILSEMGGKGLFTKEIEEAMLKGVIDLAVHSLKDVPTIIPEGLCLGAYTKRETPNDILLWNESILPKQKNKKITAEWVLKSLPYGARIGTSSLRRQAQLKDYRSDFDIIPVRGNVPTRIRKLKEHEFDAIILAGAGLNRLHLTHRNSGLIPKEIMLPAIGQGALGIECRSNDERIQGLVSKLNHPATATCVKAERAFLKTLEGGCQFPIAAFAEIKKGKLVLNGLVITPDGTDKVQGVIEGNPKEAEKLGTILAKKVLAKGGNRILQKFKKKAAVK